MENLVLCFIHSAILHNDKYKRMEWQQREDIVSGYALKLLSLAFMH